MITKRKSKKQGRILHAGHYYSPEKAVREIGLPQTPVETAIQDAVKWFSEQGMLNGTR